MKSKLLLAIVFIASLCTIYVLMSDAKTNSTTLPTNTEQQNLIHTKLIYDKPIEGYTVTADWQPFEAQNCETGLITIYFHNIATGQEFQYENREKFSSYHTDLITFADGFEGYKDGDVFTIEYVTNPDNIYSDSPIDYYLPFQFFDVDFDGIKELLINDDSKAQQGNHYTVFEITDSGLVEKAYPPFDDVDNAMVFDCEANIISRYFRDGCYFHMIVHYQKIDKMSVQRISIPLRLEERLKSTLSELSEDKPSDFHIISAEINMGDDEYVFEVKDNRWSLIEDK